jgi:hypothetical protein
MYVANKTANTYLSLTISRPPAGELSAVGSQMNLDAGVFILENTPPHPGGISADVIWWKKYEKVKRKRGKM